MKVVDVDSNMKQTAVEWLVEQLPERMKNYLNDSIAIAKLIEIDQMRAVNMMTYMNKDFDFEQYIKDHREQSK